MIQGGDNYLDSTADPPRMSAILPRKLVKHVAQTAVQNVSWMKSEHDPAPTVSFRMRIHHMRLHTFAIQRFLCVKTVRDTLLAGRFATATPSAFFLARN